MEPGRVPRLVTLPKPGTDHQEAGAAERMTIKMATISTFAVLVLGAHGQLWSYGNKAIESDSALSPAGSPAAL